jgi:putative membrane protein
MVSAGLAIFGVSVVAQGVQWTANAWQTQDWIALGGCVAGALIVGAGVGRWPPSGAVCGDCASAPTNAMKRAICCTVTRSVKGKPLELAQQAGLDQSHPALQRWYAAIHETQSDREVVSLYAQLVQPVLDARRGGKSAVRRRSRR